MTYRHGGLYQNCLYDLTGTVASVASATLDSWSKNGKTCSDAVGLTANFGELSLVQTTTSNAATPWNTISDGVEMFENRQFLRVNIEYFKNYRKTPGSLLPRQWRCLSLELQAVECVFIMMLHWFVMTFHLPNIKNMTMSLKGAPQIMCFTLRAWGRKPCWQPN